MARAVFGAKYETCPDTGKRIWIDRFDTGLVDITGDAGLLVQVNGRAAKPVADWLGERDPAWRAAITSRGCRCTWFLRRSR